ncbi:MAG: DUF488 family protein [Chloroflexi bacterium]|nr:DUF488 family protein [Chloroflexota bacterium]
MIKVKRAYELAAPEDGTRILVERLWPRGVAKERAALDLWLKDVAPSAELRKWFGHDPEKWDEFRRRYWGELKDKKEMTDLLKRKSQEGTVTLVYGSRDQEHNAAVALKEFLEA